MKDSFSARDEGCSMLPRGHIASTRFDTVQVHVHVIEELMEYADRVASPANTGNHAPWQPAFLLQDLSTGLSADDALEVADHGRVGVWAHYGPEKVVSVFDVGDPVPQRFVDGVLDRKSTRLNSSHLVISY